MTSQPAEYAMTERERERENNEPVAQLVSQWLTPKSEL